MEPDRTVEVYERVKKGKDGSPLAFFFTHGTPATYALIEKAAADKIPLIDPAGGRTESIDGTVFPYAFRAAVQLLQPSLDRHQLHRPERGRVGQAQGARRSSRSITIQPMVVPPSPP